MKFIKLKFLPLVVIAGVVLLILPGVSSAAIRYEENSPSVTFSKGWSSWDNSTYPSGGSIKFSNIAGSSATFSFIGTSVSWIDAPQPNRGIAEVFIDGVPITDGNVALSGDTGTNKSGIDLYSATDQWKKIVYAKTGLSDSAHTIMIQVTGQRNPSASEAYVGVDAFETNGSANPPSAPTGVSVSAPTYGGSLVISWSKPPEPNFSYVEIERTDVRYGNTLILPDKFTDSPAEDKNLSGGVVYSYRLRAVTTSGISSAQTALVSATPYSPAPTAAKVENEGTGGKLVLSWTNPPTGTYDFIRIYRSSASGSLGVPVTLDRIDGTSFVDSGLTNGATYFYTFRGVDFVGHESLNTDQYSGVPSVSQTRYEDTSSGITYSGTWKDFFDSNFSGGSIKASNELGASATFTFTSTSIAWIATQMTNRGIARIYIDDVPQSNVDLFSASAVFRQKVFVKSGLTSTTHTIKIQVTGTKNPAATDTWVDIDAFDFDVTQTAVITVAPPAPATTPTPTAAVAGATVGSGEIVGRVVNRAGQTIPGTAVRVNATVIPTNPGGEFKFTLVGPGVYTVYYDAPGYRGQTQMIEVKAGQSTRCPTVIMDPGITPSVQGEISGRVVNPAHQPIAWVAVRINGIVIPTNAAGEFRFGLVNPGVYTIYYDAAGYAGQTQMIEVKAGMVTYPPMVILSGTLAEIYGKVLDITTRRPIPGTAVRVNSSVMPTNPGGEFRFTLVRPGIYKVYYDAPGYKGQVQENVAVFGSATTICPTVLMSR